MDGVVAPNISESRGSSDELIDRYLRLVMHCLTRYAFIDEEPHAVLWGRKETLAAVKRAVGNRGIQVLKRLAQPLIIGDHERDARIGSVRHPRPRRRTELVRYGGSRSLREVGQDRPPFAETMIGLTRLDNVRECVSDVIRSGVPGDLIEAGTWRGGTAILMRAVVAAFGDRSRRVWVADSFAGLPVPDANRYPADAGHHFWLDAELAVSVEEVKGNFARYGLLDEQVEFLVGWFKDTLPTADIQRLAVLRIDGDLYESTLDALSALYPKVSIGGYVIVDDYGAIDSCRQAVDDYRRSQKIVDEVHQIDWTGIYWRRTG